MKTLILSSLFLYGFINHAVYAQHDVIGKSIWIQPVLEARHQLMEEREGQNHYLSTKVQFSREKTLERIKQLEEENPGFEVFVYRVDFIDGKLAIPGVEEGKFLYTPLMDGWSASRSFQKIPHEKLKTTKEYLQRNSGVALQASYYKRSLQEVVVLETDCQGEEEAREGIIWLYQRLATLKEEIKQLAPSSRKDEKKIVSLFGETCLNFDATGVRSFEDVAQTYRIVPNPKKLVYREYQESEKYQQFNPKIENKVEFYEY